MAPTNPNQGQYQTSEEKPAEQDPQKMQFVRGEEVQSPEDVKAEKVESPRKVRHGIQDNARRGQMTHPAFRQGAQRKETVAEYESEDEQTSEKEDNKSVAAESFMGVEEQSKTKKVNPVVEARRIVAKAAAQQEFVTSKFEATSLPANVAFAVKVARRWQQVPADMSDTDAMAQGFLTPEMIQLILTITLSMFQDCLPNQPTLAFRRVQNFQAAKPMDKLGDEVRLNWLVDRWMLRMAFPRDKGDVRMISKALSEEGASAKEADFRAVQTEMLFMTV